jgi:uncharacterized membrane protein HdeD (DUF308 family)
MDGMPGGPMRDVIAVFARNWWLFLVRGIAAVVFGILAIVLPGITLTALAILFGIYALVDAAGSFASAFQHREDAGHRALHVLEGLVALAVGAIAIVWPGITALALVVLIGIWAVATGIAEIAAAIRLRRVITNEWLLGLSGALSIAAGVVVFVWPNAGAVAISWVIGIYAIVFGIVLIWFGVRLRSMHSTGEPGRVPSPA